MALGKDTEAETSFLAACECVEGEKPTLLALVLTEIGDAYAKFSHPSAVGAYKEAIEIVKEERLPRSLLVPAYTRLGKIQARFGDPSAEDSLLKAVVAAKNGTSSPIEGTEAALALASFYASAQDKGEVALATLKRIAPTIASLNAKPGDIEADERIEVAKVDALQIQATAEWRLGRNESALETSARARVRDEQNLGSFAAAGHILMWQASAHASRGNFELAMKAAEQAEAHFDIEFEPKNSPGLAQATALKARLVGSCAEAIAHIPDTAEYVAEARTLGGDPVARRLEKHGDNLRFPDEIKKVLYVLFELHTDQTSAIGAAVAHAAELAKRSEELFEGAENILIKGSAGMERMFHFARVLSEHCESISLNETDDARKRAKVGDLISKYRSLDPGLATLLRAAYLPSSAAE